MDASLKAYGFKNVQELAAWREQRRRPRPPPRISKRRKYERMEREKHGGR